jgi:hypothetical protein
MTHQLRCNFCGKTVTTPVDNGTIVRAILVCPECIEAGCVVIPEPEDRRPLLPSYCASCGVYLQGGATEHKRDDDIDACTKIAVELGMDPW